MNQLTIEINETTHDCNNFKIETKGRVICQACGLELSSSLVYEYHLREPVKNKHEMLEIPITSSLFCLTTTLVPSFVKEPVRGKLLSDGERALIRAMDLVTEISRILKLPKGISARAVYIARKIVRYNKRIFKTTTTVAAAAGLYIAFREYDYNFVSLSMINLFKSMKHKVSLSNVLKVVGYYAKIVNYNRHRAAGIAIYLNRFKASVEFRSAYRAKQYALTFDAFIERVKQKYEVLKAEHVKRSGAITVGHAVLVCRAISTIERDLDVRKSNGRRTSLRVFTIPYLMQIVSRKKEMVGNDV